MDDISQALAVRGPDSDEDYEFHKKLGQVGFNNVNLEVSYLSNHNKNHTFSFSCFFFSF